MVKVNTRQPSRLRPNSHARRRHRLLGALVAVAAATLVLAPAPAGAHQDGPRPLVDGLAGPLSIDVTPKGDVLVGQGFAGLISSVDRKGRVTDLVAEPGASAVAVGPFGVVVYSVRTDDGTSLLKLRMPWGTTKLLADLGAYETKRNPDRNNRYGFESISPECAEQWPSEVFGPPQYTGLPDSNPYSLAVTHHGVYVADSGANAILWVDWDGRVRTAAVLPPQPITLPDDPSALGLPACVAGLKYSFEPVPTDVELSPHGAYATLLPGGPEDASLGARGSVVKVDLRTGRSRPVAGGFLGATGLAISPRGEIFVAEIFGGRVSKVTRSGPRTVAELEQPAALEWADGRLYVSYEVFGSGKVGTIRR